MGWLYIASSHIKTKADSFPEDGATGAIHTRQALDVGGPGTASRVFL